MGSIKVKTRDNVEEVISRLDSIPTRTGIALAVAVGEATELIHGAAVARIRKRTGRTASKIRRHHSGYQGEVFIDDEVGSYLYYGTGLHGPEARRYPIVPQNRQALRFAEGPRVQYAMRVEHPGIRGDEWLRKAAEDVSPEVERRIASRLDNALGG